MISHHIHAVLYTENLIPWEILMGIVALASAGIYWKTFVISLSLIWWCILRHTGKPTFSNNLYDIVATHNII